MAGSSGGSSPGGSKRARIEIIPLIDVVFFLLATFVLFTLSLNKSEGLTVTLPAVTTGSVRDTLNTATVTILQDGSMGWNKDSITDEQFVQRLETYKAQSGEEGKILINGDENAMFSKARYVFDQARRAGFERIYLETRIRQPGQ